MKQVAIVYHSGYGHTHILAQSVAQGVCSADTEALLLNSKEAMNTQKLAPVDAIIFGCPTYMGGVSADFKQFMETSSAVWLQQGWKNKLAAGFTNSYSLSGDKFNCLLQLFVFAMQHGMIWVGLGAVDGSPEGDMGAKDAINRTGTAMGAVAQSDNESPNITPPAGDKATAYHLGHRVATQLMRINS